MVPTPTRTPRPARVWSLPAVAIGNDPLLTIIKALGTPKLLALPLGTLDTLVRALADQATLKLGNAAHDGYLFVKQLLYEQLIVMGRLNVMAKSHLKLVAPTTEKRTVTPTRRPKCRNPDARVPDGG